MQEYLYRILLCPLSDSCPAIACIGFPLSCLLRADTVEIEDPLYYEARFGFDR